jgi:Ca2+-transporting ATPase
MNQKPRLATATFFNWKELSISILQGLIIAAGIVFIYQYAIQDGYSESTTRTMVFLTLITANIFLTLVNRSFYYSIFTTLRYKNNLIGLVIILTILLTASLLFIPAFARFFEFEKMNLAQLGISILVGTLSVIWFEGVKLFKRLAA